MPVGLLLDGSFSYNQSLFPNTSFANTNCTNGIQWLWVVLGECVFTASHIFAVICGFISIVAWVLYSVPQVVENCKVGIPDKAMSPWLLIFWTTGDTFSMVGCILSRQLFLQTGQAAYSIFSDLVLITQYLYAKYKNRNAVRLDDEDYLTDSGTIDSISVRASRDGNINGSPRTVLACFASFFGLLTFGSLFSDGWTPFSFSLNQIYAEQQNPTSRRLLVAKPTVVFLDDVNDYIGYALGCVSATFYFSARIPQLIKNVQRGTMAGLSKGLFLLALLGNLTYGMQIFITSTDSNFLLRHLPWIIGSTGVMGLDVIMMIQFFIYRSRPAPSIARILVKNEEQSPLLYS